MRGSSDRIWYTFSSRHHPPLSIHWEFERHAVIYVGVYDRATLETVHYGIITVNPDMISQFERTGLKSARPRGTIVLGTLRARFIPRDSRGGNQSAISRIILNDRDGIGGARQALRFRVFLSLHPIHRIRTRANPSSAHPPSQTAERPARGRILLEAPIGILSESDIYGVDRSL